MFRQLTASAVRLVLGFATGPRAIFAENPASRPSSIWPAVAWAADRRRAEDLPAQSGPDRAAAHRQEAFCAAPAVLLSALSLAGWAAPYGARPAALTIGPHQRNGRGLLVRATLDSRANCSSFRPIAKRAFRNRGQQCRSAPLTQLDQLPTCRLLTTFLTPSTRPANCSALAFCFASCTVPFK